MDCILRDAGMATFLVQATDKALGASGATWVTLRLGGRFGTSMEARRHLQSFKKRRVASA